MSSSISEPASRIPFLSVIPHLFCTPDLLGSLHWPSTKLFAVLLETSRAYFTEPFWCLPFLLAWSLLSCYAFLWGVISFLNNAKLTREAGNPWLMPGIVCRMLLLPLRRQTQYHLPFEGWEGYLSPRKHRVYQLYLLSPVIYLLDASPTSMVPSILS